MHLSSKFVLEARGLSKSFTLGNWWQKKFSVRALNNIDFVLRPGSTLAVVGESGSGKTTLAMCLVGLEDMDAGEIALNGTWFQSLPKPERILAQRKIQLVFQDSAGALNPSMSALEIIEEPMLIRGGISRPERQAIVEELMKQVGLSPKWKTRFPNEFSGGQRQRLAIARALVLQPTVLILDEVFVGLDLSIRGQIANLLLDLQQLHGLSYICISHDMALVGQIADTVAVLDRGRVVESGSPRELFRKRQWRISTTVAQPSRTKNLAFCARSGA
jgi:ABC-type glutathione transport system ATPase component